MGEIALELYRFVLKQFQFLDSFRSFVKEVKILKASSSG